MAHTVLVTLRIGAFCQDYEIPDNVKLQELYPRLLAVLKKENMMFRSFRGIILELDGAGLLDTTATLADYGVCTGYYLDVVKEEKYDGLR